MDGLNPNAACGGSSEHRLVRDEPHKFRIHTSAYNDRSIFEKEMRAVFDHVWIFVGHVTEIPNTGDYKTSYIGTQPVIVVRSDSGEINVLVNRCVHRGAIVCRELTGNKQQFECPYHGWVYQNDGRLLAIPHSRERGGYSEHFEMPAGLFKVPRVEMYRGLIFACLDPDVQSLDSFLGRAKLALDRKFNLSPSGEIAFRSRPFIGRYNGNWKFQSENIVDDYHFVFTHTAFIDLQAKYGDATGNFGLHPGGSASEMRKARYRGNVWGTAQGHGILDAPSLSHDGFLNGRFGEFYKARLAQFGEEEFKWMVGRSIASIFPNVGMIHQQIRTWRPIAPDLTEVTICPFDLVGAPAELNEGMIHAQERFYAPSGHGAPDDVEMFAANQHGLDGRSVEWLLLERGVDTDERLDDGDYRGQPSSEACQRGFWRKWEQLMTGN